MGDGPGNPFISNPFMQGTPKKKTPAPDPEPRRQPQRTVEQQRNSKVPEDPPPNRLDSPTELSSKAAPKASKTAPKAASKGTKKTKATSRARKTKKNSPLSSPRPLSNPSYTGNGYKVQVLAKIPMPTNTNVPSRDYLWFAVYPIIPRVGDCIFHDGRYFRVDAVFLYENTNAGWCADLEVSYYTRRH